MLKGYTYTCEDCHFSWEDARYPQYANIPCEYGCPDCRSKNVNYKETPSDPIEKSRVFSIGDPYRLGKQKAPREFREEVLGRMKRNHRRTKINTD